MITINLDRFETTGQVKEIGFRYEYSVTQIHVGAAVGNKYQADILLIEDDKTFYQKTIAFTDVGEEYILADKYKIVLKG
ncbi:hypothetical protein DUK53_08650 [Listeria sp. SHR_NRA_18]|uniref:hypothetical protein n=1 Tax=Listeria TaxID=1637 RepID=UPI00051D9D9D|nr:MULTISPECIES: hypothetical protein [Listeria]KGL46035.1 hypothetical protein EP56_02870 [Listeriaceae bacterium FSL A5-0209]RQW66697.1 hypothetical protein DUK53_08650 [Listeria sp. SHR_NRA_18]